MKIKIQNYQSHKNTELNIEDGITLIAGDSGHGKTAILRAIKALLTNQSRGDFIRHGATGCEVQIDNVIWHKDKKETYYSIDNQRYDRLGTNVPEDVYKSLLISPTDLDGEQTFLNLSEQLDAIFILKLGPSKIAKLFGAFSGTDPIYYGIQKCNKDIRDTQKQYDYLKQRIEELQSSIDSFPDLEPYYSLLQQYKLLSAYIDLSPQIIDVGIPDIEFTNIDLLRKHISAKDKIQYIPDIDLPDFNAISLLRQYFYKQEEYNKLSRDIESFIQENPECPTCGKPWE